MWYSYYLWTAYLKGSPDDHAHRQESGAERAEGAGEPPLRFVTAASLFDGHDAAINVMRRLIQDCGAEVVHLGHNRSVRDVVRAAIQEDADGIAISSYQGGHTEYFRYAVEMLREAGADHIRVFGGGGGTITPGEIADLEDFGVERIYHPNDGMSLGLVGMIDDLVERARAGAASPRPSPSERPARRPRRRPDALGARGRGDRRRRPGAAARRVDGARHRRPRWSASPAPAAPARARSPTSCSRASSSTCPTCGSRCSPSTRPGGAPAAPCSATGSG